MRDSWITLGFRESADVAAARDWIRSQVPGRRIGVIGESLGGASVLLAPQPSGFDAVVLEAVYPRIGRAVENRIRIFLGPLAPVLTPLLLVQFGAAAEPKQIWIVKGAKHQDFLRYDPKGYEEHVVGFLKEKLGS